MQKARHTAQAPADGKTLRTTFSHTTFYTIAGLAEHKHARLETLKNVM